MIKSGSMPAAVFTPALQLQTLFELNAEGRIVSTREPNPSPGPAFALVRSSIDCAWAIRADVPDELAGELDRLAREEGATSNSRDTPKHAERYLELLGGETECGPVFTFPNAFVEFSGLVAIEDVRLLEGNFHGWVSDEISGRSPILAIVEDGKAVSICFCARRSERGAEAGVETMTSFRARGLGTRVTAAWSLAITASGRMPIYSTTWSNGASLGVARKLGLIPCATDWSVFS